MSKFIKLHSGKEASYLHINNIIKVESHYYRKRGIEAQIEKRYGWYENSIIELCDNTFIIVSEPPEEIMKTVKEQKIGKFIRVSGDCYNDAESTYINIDKISKVEDYVNGAYASERTTIELKNGTAVIASETTEEIMKLIEEAENE